MTFDYHSVGKGVAVLKMAKMTFILVKFPTKGGLQPLQPSPKSANDVRQCTSPSSQLLHSFYPRITNVDTKHVFRE